MQQEYTYKLTPSHPVQSTLGRLRSHSSQSPISIEKSEEFSILQGFLTKTPASRNISKSQLFILLRLPLEGSRNTCCKSCGGMSLHGSLSDYYIIFCNIWGFVKPKPWKPYFSIHFCFLPKTYTGSEERLEQCFPMFTAS